MYTKAYLVCAMRAKPWLRCSAPLLNRRKQRNTKDTFKFSTGGQERAAGQPRIKPIPCIMMDDNITMNMGSVPTTGRWRQYFAKLLQGRVTTLADLRARSTRRLQRAGSCLKDVRFTEHDVRAAIMRKKTAGHKKSSLIVTEQTHRCASFVEKNLKTKTPCFGGARSGRLFVVKDKHQAVTTVCCGRRAPRDVESSSQTPEQVDWVDAGLCVQPLAIRCNTLPGNVLADTRFRM